MPLHVSSTVVFIINRSKLYYTASGIVTPVGGRPVCTESSLNRPALGPTHTPNMSRGSLPVGKESVASSWPQTSV